MDTSPMNNNSIYSIEVRMCVTFIFLELLSSLDAGRMVCLALDDNN